MHEILQQSIPFDPEPDQRLPGVRPLAPDGWITVDEAYGAQLAYRAGLLKTRRDRVLQLDPGVMPGAPELLDEVLALFARRAALGFAVRGTVVRCPDGREVALDRADPLGTLGLLVQEDICLLQPRDGQHVLTAAVLCFPANWTLSEKFLRPLDAIHAPVAEYDDGMARRVQRLFDGVRAGAPLWRYNALVYADPDLHQPRSESDPPRERVTAGQKSYLRSERQAILRLPRTGAAVFAIHTYVLVRPAEVAVSA